MSMIDLERWFLVSMQTSGLIKLAATSVSNGEHDYHENVLIVSLVNRSKTLEPL